VSIGAGPLTACPRCHVPLAAGARFCGGCGGAISATEQSLPGGGTATSPVELIGAEIGGRYRILAKLGEGGMGTVYRAEQISLKRKVALKLLKPELSEEPGLVRRFNAEAELAAKLNHPNTVTLFDFGQEPDGTLFIAMEFIEGRSLRELLIAGGPLPTARALHIAEQVAASLADAHAHGIVHRDLKPDNVMLMQRGRDSDVVRVLDFGIAKLRDERGDVTAMPMTQAGDLLGTPQYMAPEQIRAERVDGRTDVYALGAMLYEMVTGRLPFEAPTLMAILSKHLTDMPQPPSQRRPDLAIPPALEALIMHALQKSPDARPRSMEQVAERLAELRTSMPEAGGFRTPPPRTHTPAPGALMRPPGVPITQPPVHTPAPAPSAAPPGLAPAAPAHASGPVGTPAHLATPPPLSQGSSSSTWLWGGLGILALAGAGVAVFLLARGDKSEQAPGAYGTSGEAAADGDDDWDIAPRRDIFGDQTDHGAEPHEPAATGAGTWSHPYRGYALDLPDGFVVESAVNPDLVSFIGEVAGNPAWIVVSGEQIDPTMLNASTLPMIAETLATSAGGAVRGTEWLEVAGASRFSGIYDVSSTGMSFQFVIYTSGQLAVVAIFGTATSAFHLSKDVRGRFFDRGIDLPSAY
jgi:serine/threonine protein kinase